MQQTSDRVAIGLAVSVSLICFAVLVKTAQPSIHGGDSGELMSTACSFGVAHPPGYPTFTMVYGIVVAVARALVSPTLSPAWIGNCLSAAIGSCAAACLAVAIHRTSRERTVTTAAVSGGAALLWGFAPHVALFHSTAEVFALNNFFVTLLLLLLVECHHAVERGDYLTGRRYAVKGAFVCGLGLTNQHTFVIWLVPAALSVLWKLRTQLLPMGDTYNGLEDDDVSSGAVGDGDGNDKSATGGAGDANGKSATGGAGDANGKSATGGAGDANGNGSGKGALGSDSGSGSGKGGIGVLPGVIKAFLLGLAPYLYLPIATMQQGPAVWGEADTTGGFFTHLLRREYGTFSLGISEEHTHTSMMENTKAYIELVGSEFNGGEALGSGGGGGGSMWVFLCAAISLLLALVECVRACKPSQPHSTTAKRNVPHNSGSNNDNGNGRGGAFTRCVVAVAYIFYLGFFHKLSNLDIHQPFLRGVVARFWMQPNALLMFQTACGAISIATAIQNRFKIGTAVPSSSSSSSSSLSRNAFSMLAGIVFLSVGLGQCWSWLNHHDESNVRTVEMYGHMILDPMPINATLIARGDLVFNVVSYLQVCEGRRADITIIAASLMRGVWYNQQLSKRQAKFIIPNPTKVLTPHCPSFGGPACFSWDEILDLNVGVAFPDVDNDNDNNTGDNDKKKKKKTSKTKSGRGEDVARRRLYVAAGSDMTENMATFNNVYKLRNSGVAHEVVRLTDMAQFEKDETGMASWVREAIQWLPPMPATVVPAVTSSLDRWEINVTSTIDVMHANLAHTAFAYAATRPSDVDIKKMSIQIMSDWLDYHTNDDGHPVARGKNEKEVGDKWLQFAKTIGHANHVLMTTLAKDATKALPHIKQCAMWWRRYLRNPMWSAPTEAQQISDLTVKLEQYLGQPSKPVSKETEATKTKAGAAKGEAKDSKGKSKAKPTPSKSDAKSRASPTPAPTPAAAPAAKPTSTSSNTGKKKKKKK